MVSTRYSVIKEALCDSFHTVACSTVDEWVDIFSSQVSHDLLYIEGSLNCYHHQRIQGCLNQTITQIVCPFLWMTATSCRFLST